MMVRVKVDHRKLLEQRSVWDQIECLADIENTDQISALLLRQEKSPTACPRLGSAHQGVSRQCGKCVFREACLAT